MARDKSTGAKTTATKSFRQNWKAAVSTVRSQDAGNEQSAAASRTRWDRKHEHAARVARKFQGES